VLVTSPGLKPLSQLPKTALLFEKPEPKFPFYIDEQGNALNGAGKPIKASEVKGDLVDLRGMDGDVKTIKWADGSTGLNGADLTIVAV